LADNIHLEKGSGKKYNRGGGGEKTPQNSLKKKKKRIFQIEGVRKKKIIE